MQEPQQFLHDIFKNKPDESFILLWQLRDHRSTWFKDIDYAADFISLSPEDIFFGVGLSNHDFGSHKRCPQNKVSGIPGLYVDIDIKDPQAHNNPKPYPDTMEEAMEIAQYHEGLKPTLIVDSGYGIHCYWLFDRIWLFENEIDRLNAKNLSKRMNMMLIDKAMYYGKIIDSVFDLSRVLRPAGSMNCKKDTPKKVRVILNDGPRYSKEELDILIPKEKLLTQSLIITPPPDKIQNDILTNQQSTTPKPAASSASSAPDIKTQLMAPPPSPPNGIQIDLQAEPNPSKMMELATIFENFLATWNYSRPDLPSPSEYDMSLANFGVKIGMTDQEIANMIIAFRRRHNLDLKKCERVKYMGDTILKAKKKVNGEAIKDIEYFNRAHGTEYETADAVAKCLEAINKKIGVNGFKIRKFIKHVFGPMPNDIKYTLETNKGNVYSDHKMMDSQVNFRREIKNAPGVSVPIEPMKKKEWNEIEAALFKIIEERYVGDTTINEKLTSWIEEYIGKHTKKSFKDSVISREPFYDITNSAWYIYFESFRTFVLAQKEDINDYDLKRFLSESKFKPKRKRGVINPGTPAVSRNVWKVPLTKFNI